MSTLHLQCTPAVQATLSRASRLATLPADLREEVRLGSASATVPWRLVQRACCALRVSGCPPGPWLHRLVRGGLLLPPVCERPPRSAALEQRVERLRGAAAERSYQALVADVTRAEAAERDRVPLAGAVRELGFVAHVVSVMGACFVAGYCVGRRMFPHQQGLQLAVAAVAMLCALLVETALFVLQAEHAEREGAKKKRA